MSFICRLDLSTGRYKPILKFETLIIPSHVLPILVMLNKKETRPDTRLPMSRAGGQGPYLRSLDDVGRSSEVQEIKS